jgi:hypothetical protein
MSAQVISVASQLEAQSVNAIVAGFSFASALAWMDVVRYIIGQTVKVDKNGAQYVLLTALMTTLLSVVIYMILARFSKKVVPPGPLQYAVTAAR